MSHFESHLTYFITFCHILNHILSSSHPHAAFCEDATKTCPWFFFTFLFGFGTVIHKYKFTLSCLFWWVTGLSAYSRPFLFCPNSGLGLLFWQVWVTSRYQFKPPPIVNVSHCCLFWSFFWGQSQENELSSTHFGWILQILLHTFFSVCAVFVTVTWLKV